MNYYKFIYDYWNDKNRVKAEAQDSMEGLDRYDLDRGIEITQWNEYFKFSYNPKEGKVFTDFLKNNLGWIIASQNLKKVISILQPTNIQYLPVKVVNMKTNEVNHIYSVDNLIDNIEALDLENSVL